MLDAHRQIGSYDKKFIILGPPLVLVAEELLKWTMKHTFKLQFLMFMLLYFICLTFDESALLEDKGYFKKCFLIV